MFQIHAKSDPMHKISSSLTFHYYKDNMQFPFNDTITSQSNEID